MLENSGKKDKSQQPHGLKNLCMSIVLHISNSHARKTYFCLRTAQDHRPRPHGKLDSCEERGRTRGGRLQESICRRLIARIGRSLAHCKNLSAGRRSDFTPNCIFESVMSHILGDATPQVATFIRHLGPKVQKSCNEWVQHSFSLQRYKGWTFSTVICGIGSVESTITGQVPVYDAVAPPSVRIGNYRVAPRMLAYKARRIKRRSHRGGGDGDDDGPEWDEGGFGGSGGWSGSDNGRGGNDYWGASWNEDGWWWEDASEAAFGFIYEVACWVSLTQCLQFVLKKLLDVVHNGVDDSAVDAGSFAQCSWVFVNPESGRGSMAVDHHMPRLTWPRVSS